MKGGAGGGESRGRVGGVRMFVGNLAHSTNKVFCRRTWRFLVSHASQASLVACLSSFGRILDSFLPMDRSHSSLHHFPHSLLLLLLLLLFRRRRLGQHVTQCLREQPEKNKGFGFVTFEDMTMATAAKEGGR